jgi:hypothetical protein
MKMPLSWSLNYQFEPPSHRGVLETAGFLHHPNHPSKNDAGGSGQVAREHIIWVATAQWPAVTGVTVPSGPVVKYG